MSPRIERDIYVKSLKERGKKNKAYSAYQFTGVEIADILDDTEHKSLYIKLAKEHGCSKMLAMAKDVAERKGIKNKGAYFMKLAYPEKEKNDKNRNN